MRRKHFIVGGMLLTLLCSAVLAEQPQGTQQQGRRGQANQQGARQGTRQGQRGRQGRGRNQDRLQLQPGDLRPGQMAPTFELMSLDGASQYSLKDFRGEKPVVLFFGSYT